MSQQIRFARLLLIAAVALAPVSALAENDGLDRIVRAGLVRIGVPDNFPPFGDLDPDAKLRGYDVDMAALVAAGLGVKAELVAVASTERISALTDGKVDLVISSLGKNSEREKQIDFSAAYAPFYNGIFGPADLAATKPEDLAGKSVAVTRDTIEDADLTKAAPPGATIKRFDDNGRTEVAFVFDQADLIATGNVVAAQILATNPARKPLLKFLLHNSPCYVGVAKGQPALLARVDAIVAGARHDGSLDRLSRQWLKAPLDDPENPAAMAAK
jgi:polar amino acid transport system substrate-binding protein